MSEENLPKLALTSYDQFPHIYRYVTVSHGRRRPRPSMTAPEAAYLVLAELVFLRTANVVEIERLLSESEDSEFEDTEGSSGKKDLADAVRSVFKSDAPMGKLLVGDVPAPLTADPLVEAEARPISIRIEQALAALGLEDLDLQIVKERLADRPGQKRLPTFAEIGEKFELPTSTVYDLFRKGIKRLAKELGE